MWTPARDKLIKVRLHDRGQDVETPWAEDLGLVPDRPGARRVRLGNVPFLHAKPTYGDVIVVERDREGDRLAWDSEGVAYENIAQRIEEDGGRYAVILDYQLTPEAIDARAAFRALDLAGEAADFAVEGCHEPRGSRPGRAYLAVPYEVDTAMVLSTLRAALLPLELTLVHPREDHEES